MKTYFTAVTATSGAGKKVLDIMKVKPGCVITDVARPLDLPAEEVAKRPDVLVIESGEIQLPGEVEMKNIGLPKGVAYACLAETIVLALEGRFENFTVGRAIEWEKVREIYKLGLKHGMKLAAISGVNGVFTDEAIAKVVTLAKKARLTWTGSSTTTSARCRKRRVTSSCVRKTDSRPGVSTRLRFSSSGLGWKTVSTSPARVRWMSGPLRRITMWSVVGIGPTSITSSPSSALITLDLPEPNGPAITIRKGWLVWNRASRACSISASGRPSTRLSVSRSSVISSCSWRRIVS